MRSLVSSNNVPRNLLCIHIGIKNWKKQRKIISVMSAKINSDGCHNGEMTTRNFAPRTFNPTRVLILRSLGEKTWNLAERSSLLNPELHQRILPKYDYKHSPSVPSSPSKPPPRGGPGFRFQRFGEETEPRVQHPTPIAETVSNKNCSPENYGGVNLNRVFPITESEIVSPISKLGYAAQGLP